MAGAEAAGAMGRGWVRVYLLTMSPSIKSQPALSPSVHQSPFSLATHFLNCFSLPEFVIYVHDLKTCCSLSLLHVFSYPFRLIC